MPVANVSLEAAARSDGKKVFGNQGIQIGRMEIVTKSEEMPADPQGDREVDLIGVAFLLSLSQRSWNLEKKQQGREASEALA